MDNYQFTPQELQKLKQGIDIFADGATQPYSNDDELILNELAKRAKLMKEREAYQRLGGGDMYHMLNSSNGYEPSEQELYDMMYESY